MESSDHQSHNKYETTNSSLSAEASSSKIMTNDSETIAFGCTPFEYRSQSLRSLHLSQCSLDTSVIEDDDDMEYRHNHAASMTHAQYDWLALLYMEPEDSHHSRAHHILEQKQEFDDSKDSIIFDNGADENIGVADDTMSCAGDGANVLPRKRKQDRQVSFMEEESPSKRIHMMVTNTGSDR